jgi:nuclear mRNA export protein PCID2/THP1
LIARLVNGLGPFDLKPNAPIVAGVPPAKTPPPILKLAQFLIIARRAWKDDGLALDDVECVVASLIDQGYVKGYAMHSSGNVVLRRTADFGFVRMSTVY